MDLHQYNLLQYCRDMVMSDLYLDICLGLFVNQEQDKFNLSN